MSRGFVRCSQCRGKGTSSIWACGGCLGRGFVRSAGVPPIWLVLSVAFVCALLAQAVIR